MRKYMWTKGLLVGIICLFVGASVTPILSSNLNNVTVKENDLSPINNPSWQWAKSGGGTGSDAGWDVAVDANGNAYITGWFSGTATFGSTTLTGQGGLDVFVAKLSTSGAWQWAKSAGGTSGGYGTDVAVDANGNAYITGYFMGTATFGNTTLTSQGNRDVFVAKLSTSGAWQWATSAGGTDLDEGCGVAVDPSGNTYITGTFYDAATFGTTNLTSQGSYDVFVAKLTTNGAWQWAVSAGGTDFEEGRDVAVDGNGNVYIFGTFYDWALFGSTNLTSYGGYDVFVAKLTTNGGWQWARSAGGTGGDDGGGAAVDGNGNVYIIGYFHLTATFGSTTLTSQGGYDVFVAKLSTSGAWQWAKRVGGTEDDQGLGVKIDGNGNVYITGYFMGTATFGSTNLTSQGNDDVFIAKLSSGENQPPVADFTWTPQNPSSNQQITFDASASQDPNGTITLYEWDWNNDGTYEEVHTTSIVTYSWSNAGNYLVTLRVTDNDEMTNSTTKTVNVGGGNQPPNPPTITGPAKGKVRVATDYNFTAIDPDGDEVYYFIDWGDDTNSSWIGPYSSGDKITKSHTWSKKGTYTLKAKAKDTYGNESDWAALSVTMPCSYNIPLIQFWERLLELFPNAFPILRYILGY